MHIITVSIYYSYSFQPTEGVYSDVVDIYTSQSDGAGVWSTARLSQGRQNLAASSLAGQSLSFFGGGYASAGALPSNVEMT